MMHEVHKNDSFSELRVFEMAKGEVSAYFRAQERKLWNLLNDQKIDQKEYDRRQKALNKLQKESNEYMSKIRLAMDSCEALVQKVTTYDSIKLEKYLGILDNSKILMVARKETEKIKSRKRKVKKSLVDALKEKNLRKIMTDFMVVYRNQKFFAYENENHGTNLQHILDSLKSTKEEIANQFVAKAEKGEIKKHVDDVKDSFDSPNIYLKSIPATLAAGQTVRIYDKDMKDFPNYFGLSKEEIEEKKNEEAVSLDFTVRKIDYILNSKYSLSFEDKKRLNTAKKEYIAICRLNLEIHRVEKARSLLVNRQIGDSYEKTSKLLNQYYGDLLREREKAISKLSVPLDEVEELYARCQEYDKKLSYSENLSKIIRLLEDSKLSYEDRVSLQDQAKFYQEYLSTDHMAYRSKR